MARFSVRYVAPSLSGSEVMTPYGITVRFERCSNGLLDANGG